MIIQKWIDNVVINTEVEIEIISGDDISFVFYGDEELEGYGPYILGVCDAEQRYEHQICLACHHFEPRSLF